MESSGNRVCIVGPQQLLNELLAQHISARTGIACTLLKAVDSFRSSGQDSSENCLLLMDCPPTTEAVRDSLRGLSRDSGPNFAMFNVAAGRGIETVAIPCGVRGFFYETDGPDILLRGIKALFGGELWISRKVMSECLLRGGKQEHVDPCRDIDTLTARESEVLAKVAAGWSNEDIASELCISPHTVKTHVYRIFDKIGASNRVHASLWAAKNLRVAPQRHTKKVVFLPEPPDLAASF